MESKKSIKLALIAGIFAVIAGAIPNIIDWVRFGFGQDKIDTAVKAYFEKNHEDFIGPAGMPGKPGKDGNLGSINFGELEVKGTNTINLANTNGFVMAVFGPSNNPNQSNMCGLIGDSQSSVNVTVSSSSREQINTSFDPFGSILFPVKEGKFWTVTKCIDQGDKLTGTTVYWLPISIR